MWTPRRGARPLTLLGLVFAMACEPDLTGPGRETKPVDPPQFVLLAPGTVAQVSAGSYYTCALRKDGTVACWGLNDYGHATPPAGMFTQVSAGGFHTCGLRPDGTLACWGSNSSGDACATFGGIGRVDTGGLVAFSVDACDHGTPGAGVDFFGLSVPYFNYNKSGTLTQGEVTLTTL